MDEYPKTTGDHVYEQYKLLAEYRFENDIPRDDALPFDTRITQGISEPGPRSQAEEDTEEELPDIPDADELQMNSPVDPAAPDTDAMHGTDLLNGYDGDEAEEE
ncbi:hypothetical protein [Paenibacillus aceti]|uniref:Transposase n=1 Tax=Paenibacillus aceti TaxID=1820010 RepID=A0ABQ1VWA1_9BACL|nr:hypothetical protein [Paenibacillus aceti]GGG02564.1 hypothetical protein GCM10010913_25370 [Paenibacillus aceti]